MKRYFLGIDIGTFESRGILIDESFRVAADASVPHGMDNPQPGWFEQEAEAVWWGDLCKLCRTLIKQSGIRPEQIACVGTSALGTDCLPVDEQCRPLRPAILYGIDARASEEAAWLTEHSDRRGCRSCSAIPSAPATRPQRSSGCGGMSRRSTQRRPISSRAAPF